MIRNNICDISTRVLIYVHSAPKHFEKRQAMRRTWCQKGNFNGKDIKTAFIIGRSDPSTNKRIKMESDAYKDIIQADFTDSYINLTYKAIVALDWIRTSCRGLQWVIKADDDMFVDIKRAIGTLLPNYMAYNRTILGYCKHKKYNLKISRSGRSCRSRWCIFSDYFPREKFYPPHCIGAVIILSGDLIRPLYEASMKATYFWIDDVYLTGLLMQIVQNGTFINLQTSSRHRIDPNGNDCMSAFTKPETFPYVACRAGSVNQFKLFWDRAHSGY